MDVSDYPPKKRRNLKRPRGDMSTNPNEGSGYEVSWGGSENRTVIEEEQQTVQRNTELYEQVNSVRNLCMTDNILGF